MDKTLAHILEIGCSGLIGVFITIGYQHFSASNQSFTFFYNGEEMKVTEYTYTELVDQNELLKSELSQTQNQLNQLQEQLNQQQVRIDENETQFNEQQESPHSVSLTSLEYFTKKGTIDTNLSFDRTDNYDTTYTTCISPFDSGETYIEYYLGGEYTNLSGMIYITSHAKRINPDYYTWDIATFSIYGDDVLLESHTGFSTKDKPLDISVNITGVEFLRISFNNAHYYDTGMSESLIGFGNPTIS